MIIPGGQERRHIVASTEKEQEQEGESFLQPLWQRYQVCGLSAPKLSTGFQKVSETESHAEALGEEEVDWCQHG